MKNLHRTIHGDWVETEVVCDGDSLPMLQLNMRYSKLDRVMWILMDKEQATQLVVDLQNKLTEM